MLEVPHFSMILLKFKFCQFAGTTWHRIQTKPWYRSWTKTWNWTQTKDYKVQGLYRQDFQEYPETVKKLFSDPPESMVKKWSFDGSGPPQKMCPKSYQQIDKYETNSYIFNEHEFTHISLIDGEIYYTTNLHGLLYNLSKWLSNRGYLFIDVFQKYANGIENAEFLAQGTLYPDVIESVSFKGGPSVTIKSHHNVGGLPEKMGLKLVEPLRELFKDEVRALGRELKLPKNFINRHPFPGPGLAIRCPGKITRNKLEILRKADAVYIDQINKHGLYNEIWQAFVAILPVRTVGVMGDGRTYDYACTLRAVTSVDGMTADYYPFTHEFLSETATRLINEVEGINRVTYDITSKPPGTIEWE